MGRTRGTKAAVSFAVLALGAPAARAQAPVPDNTRPVLTKPALNPAAAAVGKARELRFTLSEAARVSGVITQLRSGYRVRGRCRLDAVARRGRRPCSHSVRVGSLPGTAAAAGANRAMLRTTHLTAGGYALVLSAADAAGNAARPVRLALEVTKGTR